MAQENQQPVNTESSQTDQAANGSYAGKRNGDAPAPADASAPQVQGQNGGGDGKPSAAPSFTRSPLFKVIAGIAIVAAIIGGIYFYVVSQNHVETDDAYIAGDLINISPIISGTLSTLTVDEGDQVRAGEVIAVLDKSGPLAAYEQEKAAYEAAESQIPQAQSNLTYQSETVDAAINQARAALSAQEAKTQQSQQQVYLTAQTTESQVAQSEAQAEAALSQAQTAQAQAISLLQAIQSAKSAAAASHQQVAVAQANYVKAQNDETRYASLYGTNGQVAAVTAQQLDQVVDTADTAKAQLQSAHDSAGQADAQVAVSTAQARAAQSAVDTAMKQYTAALAQVRIAQANRMQVPVQRFGVANNAAIGQQNSAELQAAVAGTTQVRLRQQQVTTAEATAEQALAAMQNAKVTLDDCTITAPSNGVVVRKGVNVGDALTPGQTIVTMTQGSRTWVAANFKETQIDGIEPGEPVKIDVDAFPGKVFHGKVLSINEASGNTTSLLPADNATGNFTKVVQRIPVKIVFVVPQNPGTGDATQQDIDNLRQGMSCTPDIDISSGRK
jgi:membrane fusion protein, multidrug efflux system